MLSKIVQKAKMRAISSSGNEVDLVIGGRSETDDKVNWRMRLAGILVDPKTHS
jgi:hypothetical protein